MSGIASLHVDYLRPTPLDVLLEIRARVTELKGRKVVMGATLKRRVAKLIKQGRLTAAGLAKVKEAKANGQWRAAALRADRANLPGDLRQALKNNPQAQSTFDRLAPSPKQQYLNWIASAKTDKTRQRRIQETIKLVAQVLHHATTKGDPPSCRWDCLPTKNANRPRRLY